MQPQPQIVFPEGTNCNVFDGKWNKLQLLSLSKILYINLLLYLMPTVNLFQLYNIIFESESDCNFFHLQSNKYN